jgi:hypothetical protein
MDQEIEEYARAMASTPRDLDPALEAAGIEALVATDPPT